MGMMLSDSYPCPNSGLNINRWRNHRTIQIGLGEPKSIVCWYLVSRGHYKPLRISAVDILGAIRRL